MATKFDTLRPVVYEVRFRTNAARRVADHLRSGRASVVESAEAVDVMDDGFGWVAVTVRATNDHEAEHRVERALRKIGAWEDRSGGEYGDAVVLIFVAGAGVETC